MVKDRRLLLCLRSATRNYYPAVWDLPGGHVEKCESCAAALRRELEEELGIVVSDAIVPYARLVDEMAGFDLQLWRVASWTGEPDNRCPAEHDRIGWFSQAEMRGLRLALPAYRQVFQRVIAQAD